MNTIQKILVLTNEALILARKEGKGFLFFVGICLVFFIPFFVFSWLIGHAATHWFHVHTLNYSNARGVWPFHIKIAESQYSFGCMATVTLMVMFFLSLIVWNWVVLIKEKWASL